MSNKAVTFLRDGALGAYQARSPKNFPDSVILENDAGIHVQLFKSTYRAWEKAQESATKTNPNHQWQDPIAWAKNNNLGVYSEAKNITILGTPIKLVEKEGQPRTFGDGNISSEKKTDVRGNTIVTPLVLKGGSFGVISPDAGFPLVDKGTEPISVYVTTKAQQANEKPGGYKGTVIVLDQKDFKKGMEEPFSGSYAEKKVVFGNLADAKAVMGSTYREGKPGFQRHAPSEGAYYELSAQQYEKVRDHWKMNPDDAEMSMQDLIQKHGKKLGIDFSVMKMPTYQVQSGDTLFKIADKFPKGNDDALQTINGMIASGKISGGTTANEYLRTAFTGALVRLNGIKNPDDIPAGKELQIPDAASVNIAAAALAIAASEKSKGGSKITYDELSQVQDGLIRDSNAPIPPKTSRAI